MARKTVSIEPPEPEFTLFSTSRDGLPEVAIVNRALLGFRHNEIFPWHLSVTIAYAEFADNEMPTPRESEVLNQTCDRIEAVAAAARTESGAVNCLFVARSTWGGTREILWQVHDPDSIHGALQDLLGEDWPLAWSYRMDHDPQWAGALSYLRLFAGPEGRDH